MHETPPFFMYLLEVKDKNEETKQDQWRRKQNTFYNTVMTVAPVDIIFIEHSIL